MHWRIKGLTQKMLGAIPGGVVINDMLQRTLGELSHFDTSLAGQIAGWTIIVSYLRNAGIALTNLELVEIGTGWFPTLPICFALAGAARCVSYDLNRHLSSRLTYRMLRGLREHLQTIGHASGRPLP